MRTVADATGLIRYTTTSRKKGGQRIFLVLGRITARFKTIHLQSGNQPRAPRFRRRASFSRCFLSFRRCSAVNLFPVSPFGRRGGLLDHPWRIAFFGLRAFDLSCRGPPSLSSSRPFHRIASQDH